MERIQPKLKFRSRGILKNKYQIFIYTSENPYHLKGSLLI